MRKNTFKALGTILCALMTIASSAAFAAVTEIDAATPTEANSATTDTVVDRDPAQAPIKVPPKGTEASSPTTVPNDDNVPPRNALPSGPRHRRSQFSLVGGYAITGRADLDKRIYKHQPERSPAGRLGWQFTFFPGRTFQMLLGVEGMAIRTVAVASSSLSAATYTTDDVYVGPSIGIGWAPAGPGGSFSIEASIATGIEASHVATLQSGGFTTNIKKRNLSNFAAWGSLMGSFAVTPGFKILGGFTIVGNTNPLMVGVAYAF